MGAETARLNLSHIIEGHPADHVALISRNRPTTYGELVDQVGRLRGGLAGMGVGEGDRVAIVCGNTRHFVITYLATIGLGAVAIPLNPASPALELRRELEVIDPALVVCEPHSATVLAHLESGFPSGVRRLLVTEGEPPDGWSTLDDLIGAEPVAIVDVEPDSVAVMMFTSGTAGAPRAAMLSHHNLHSNILQSRSSPVHTESDDVVYGVLPLFHIYGLNVVLGASLAAGATVLLVQRFDPATAADSIFNRRITVLPGAPPMWVAFADFDELPAETFRTVRIAGSGAAKLPVRVAERMQERFGLTVYEGYGLTEASPVVTSSSALGESPRFGSVGRALPGVEVRLVDEHGDDVLVGDPGEIRVRGPNVFLGYYHEPDATARVLDADGWLHTGDVATVDDDGWLYLVDRAKDLIIVSGFNVFPAEVEQVLTMHPAVAEVGVVGVPHPHHGEAVKAYVALEPGADVDEDTLIGFCADHLARYKCPSKIIFVDELPRNISGKLLRRHLGDTILD